MVERKGIEPSTFALRIAATRNGAQSNTKEIGELSPIPARDSALLRGATRGSVHQICTGHEGHTPVGHSGAGARDELLGPVD